MGHKCDGCRYKGEHQEMMFRPFGVCTRELNLADAEKNYNADKCSYDIAEALHGNFVTAGRGSDKMSDSLDKVLNSLMDYEQTIEMIRRHYCG